MPKKHSIDKIMFIYCGARPRFDADGNCTHDGKIGMFSFVIEISTICGSHNRLRGTMETKPLRATKVVSPEFLVEKLPSRRSGYWRIVEATYSFNKITRRLIYNHMKMNL
jgi:hypothetical protein